MSTELKEAAEKALVVLGSATSFMSRKSRDQHESVITALRTAIQQADAKTDEPVLPDGYVVAPHFRGYARLGIGAYLINHSAPGHEPELVISVATEDEKAGRSVGEDQDNAPGSEIQPEQISVRLCFENVAGLDALEKQLRYLREVHFSGTHPAPGVPDDVQRDAERLNELEALVKSKGTHGLSFDYCMHVEDGYVVEKGFRMMWRHHLGERKPTLRAALDALTAAQAQKGGECLPIRGNQVTCSRGTGGCGIQHKGGD